MPNEIPSATRKMVIERDMDQCVRCGSQGSEIQHRVRRREGKHPVSNLIRVCRTCHSWMHSHPREANEQGLVLKTWQAPVEEPVRTFRGWMLLDDEGHITYVALPNKERNYRYEQEHSG